MTTEALSRLHGNAAAKRQHGSGGVLDRARRKVRREERARCVAIVEGWRASKEVRAALALVAEALRGR